MDNDPSGWVIYGVDYDDPYCIHTVDEAIEYINEVGFLPLFRNDIPGFSLEERTCAEKWWCDKPDEDPWIWRAIIASRKDIVYGRFFDRKTGFITKKWLPYFVNYRRDGYDFDSLYEDGKASKKQKRVMDFFTEENQEAEIFSHELKKAAGFGKNGEKGFDGVMSNLMMQFYLCNSDFRKRRNKAGNEYGWDVAVYSTLEHIHGYDYVTSAYKEDPRESWEKLVNHMKEVYPIATDKQIRKLLK